MTVLIIIPDFFEATVAEYLKGKSWINHGAQEVIVFAVFPDGR